MPSSRIRSTAKFSIISWSLWQLICTILVFFSQVPQLPWMSFPGTSGSGNLPRSFLVHGRSFYCDGVTNAVPCHYLLFFFKGLICFLIHGSCGAWLCLPSHVPNLMIYWLCTCFHKKTWFGLSWQKSWRNPSIICQIGFGDHWWHTY